MAGMTDVGESNAIAQFGLETLEAAAIPGIDESLDASLESDDDCE
jgi:hypothetical protein